MRWLVMVLALLAACDAEKPAPRAESQPACVTDRRVCGLAPPQRGASYKLTTITGESFWLTLPAELAHDVVALPSAPLSLKASLTTAAPRDAADRFCDQFPACEPIAVNRKRDLVRWDDASGTIRDLEVTTVDLGAWTLVLAEPDAGKAESLASAISAETDEDGYPRLSGAVHADWASVMLWVGRHFIQVMPGCELTKKRPDLGGADAGPDVEPHPIDSPAGGTWCVGGRYWVSVTFANRATLERLHEQLTVVPD